MNKDDQNTFLENWGLEQGYTTIKEVIDDRDELEELGYNVDDIILSFLDVLGVQK